MCLMNCSTAAFHSEKQWLSVYTPLDREYRWRQYIAAHICPPDSQPIFGPRRQRGPAPDRLSSDDILIFAADCSTAETSNQWAAHVG